MAYFITASASASVEIQFLSASVIASESTFTDNDPINVDSIVTFKKGNSEFPNQSRPLYKDSISFINCEGKSSNWLYNDTASRDSDFNIIKALNTNYNPVASSPAGKATNIQYNGGGYFDSSDKFTFTSTTSTLSVSGTLEVTGSIYGEGSNITNLQRPVSLSVSINMTASNDSAGFFFEVGAVNCSIQSSSLVACDIGSEFEFFQSSSGNFTFVTGSGVTLRSKGGALTLTGQYSAATLKKIRAEEWVLVGDLA